MQQVKRFALALLLVIFLALILVTPALAAIAQPDSLAVEHVWVYRNCRQAGDQLYLVYYSINYSTLPDPPADETYIVRLMDGDDTVALAYPVSYHDKGYGDGLAALYFAPGDAPTWVWPYSMELIGNPFQDWVGGVPEDELDTFDIWQDLEVGTGAAIIAGRIIWIANELEDAWGEDMVTTSDTGEDVLTAYAAAYFYNVIPYLSDIAPEVFPEGAYMPVDVVEPEIPPDTAGTDYADWLEEIIEDTPFDLSAVADKLGVSRGPFTAFLYYGVVAFALVLVARALGSYKPVMLLAVPLVWLGAFVGVPLIIVIIVGFISLGLVGYILFYKPSPA